MSVTRVTTSPVSDLQFVISLPGGRFSAKVRPPNFDELATATAEPDGLARVAKLYELCAIDHDPKMTIAAKRSIGQQILTQLCGEGLTAVEVSEHGLPDEAADVLLKKRTGNPGKDFVCLEMDDALYLLFGPEPSLVDGVTKKKMKEATTNLHHDLAFLERHLFFGDLAPLKREKPCGVMELCRKMYEIGGVALQADVKKA